MGKIISVALLAGVWLMAASGGVRADEAGASVTQVAQGGEQGVGQQVERQDDKIGQAKTEQATVAAETAKPAEGITQSGGKSDSEEKLQGAEYGQIKMDQGELENEDDDGEEEEEKGDEPEEELADDGETGGDAVEELAPKHRRSDLAESMFHMDDFSPSHVFTFLLEQGEECFFEDILNGPTSIRGAYFASSSEGSNKVSVQVSRVDGVGRVAVHELFSDYGRAEGTFSVVAEKPGQFRICFGQAGYGKRVTFALHVGRRKREGAKPEHITPLEESIRGCHRTLQQLVSEQTFLINRVQSHMATQDSTEWRIGYYTVFESVFMIAVTLTQVIYVQRLINNRQWV